MGSIKKQGVQNAIINFIGVSIGFVSLLFIQPNLLKAEELGLTRILIAAASLIAAILPLGISSITTKFFPYFRNVEKKHFGFFGFILLFILVGTTISGILIYSFKNIILNLYTQQSFLFTRFFDLLLPFAIIISLNIALNAYCYSIFKTSIISLFEGIIVRILFVLIIVIYYFQWINLTQFIYLFIGIYLFQALSIIIYIHQVDTLSFKINTSQFKSIGTSKMVTFGLLLTLTNISSLSLKHLDSLMIGKYLTLDYVGIFAVSAYIALIIELPLSSLEKITHSKVSQAWANKDLDSIKKIYYLSVKYLMLAGGLLLVGILINIHDLLNLLPETYHKGATVTIIASVGAFLNIATGVNTSILFTSEKYIYGTFLLFFLFVLSIILNILLIPAYGIEGAAIATAISSVIYNTFKYFIIWKNFKLQPFNRSSLKILVVIFISFSVAYFLPGFKTSIASILFHSLVITSVYGILTYLLQIVPEFHNYIPFRKRK